MGKVLKNPWLFNVITDYHPFSLIEWFENGSFLQIIKILEYPSVTNDFKTTCAINDGFIKMHAILTDKCYQKFTEEHYDYDYSNIKGSIMIPLQFKCSITNNRNPEFILIINSFTLFGCEHSDEHCSPTWANQLVSVRNHLIWSQFLIKQTDECLLKFAPKLCRNDYDTFSNLKIVNQALLVQLADVNSVNVKDVSWISMDDIQKNSQKNSQQKDKQEGSERNYHLVDNLAEIENNFVESLSQITQGKLSLTFFPSQIPTQIQSISSQKTCIDISSEMDIPSNLLSNDSFNDDQICSSADNSKNSPKYNMKINKEMSLISDTSIVHDNNFSSTDQLPTADSFLESQTTEIKNKPQPTNQPTTSAVANKYLENNEVNSPHNLSDELFPNLKETNIDNNMNKNNKKRLDSIIDSMMDLRKKRLQNYV